MLGLLYEPSHLDLRCLTFSLSILGINFFSSDYLLKKKKADDKCRLKFGTERVNIGFIKLYQFLD